MAIAIALRRSSRGLGILLLTLAVSSARSAANLRILVDGRTVVLNTGNETLRDAAHDAGRSAPAEPLHGPAPHVAAPSTVGDALSEAGIVLSATDEVSPGLDQPLPESGLIRVSRVHIEHETAEVKIPYQTVVRPATRSQHPYHPTVIQEGHVGLKRVAFEARVVDGKEVSRTQQEEVIVRNPIPQIVISRQPAILGSRGAYSGIRTFTVLATAYDPGPGSCGKFANGQTCNGKRAGYGVIAVDPKMIPLGAKLFVPGYGYGIAADVGSAIKGRHVDLGFNSRPGARAWGKKWLTLRIVD